MTRDRIKFPGEKVNDTLLEMMQHAIQIKDPIERSAMQRIVERKAIQKDRICNWAKMTIEYANINR